jgi:hypothetical protein
MIEAGLLHELTVTAAEMAPPATSAAAEEVARNAHADEVAAVRRSADVHAAAKRIRTMVAGRGRRYVDPEDREISR